MKVLLFKTRASFSLFGHSECHQGLTVKTSGLKKSYKSLKTAAVLRPSLTNFFSVSGNPQSSLQRRSGGSARASHGRLSLGRSVAGKLLAEITPLLQTSHVGGSLLASCRDLGTVEALLCGRTQPLLLAGPPR